MEPIRGPEDLVLPDIAPPILPVLRVFDEIADGQPDVAFNRGERPEHPTPAEDLHVQWFLPIGRGDPFLIDSGKS